MGPDLEIVNLDCVKRVLRRGGPIADYALIWGEIYIAIVELKGGQAGSPVEKVRQQIQGGLDAIAAVTDAQPVREFYPLWLFKGRDPTSSLGDVRVTFRGTKHRILAYRCGSRLKKILQDVRLRRANQS